MTKSTRSDGPAKSVGSEKTNLPVRSYDFHQPRTLNQAQRVKVGGMISRLAPRLSEIFSGGPWPPAQSIFLGLEQIQSGSWPGRDAEDAITARVLMQPGPGEVFIRWPRPLAFWLIEKLLGGTGEDLFIDNEITGVEGDILKKYSLVVAQALQSTWERDTFTSAVCEELFENKKSLQAACGPEIMLIGSLSLNWPNRQEKLSFIFPYPVIRNWLGMKLASRSSCEQLPPIGAHGLSRALEQAPVTLVVRLNPTSIRLKEFTSLQVGDCLQLAHGPDDPVEICLGDQPKFKGHLGTKGRKVAVKITGAVTNPFPASAGNEVKDGKQ